MGNRLGSRFLSLGIVGLISFMHCSASFQNHVEVQGNARQFGFHKRVVGTAVAASGGSSPAWLTVGLLPKRPASIDCLAHGLRAACRSHVSKMKWLLLYSGQLLSSPKLCWSAYPQRRVRRLFDRCCFAQSVWLYVVPDHLSLPCPQFVGGLSGFWCQGESTTLKAVPCSMWFVGQWHHHHLGVS